MTGDRSLLAGRIAAMCGNKLAEKDDYVLIGPRPRTLPDDIPPGRAYRADLCPPAGIADHLLRSSAPARSGS